MNEAELRREIEEDLQRSTGGSILYLEGKTDPDAFFALLGGQIRSDEARGGINLDGVYVRGLSEKGSGASAVRSRVDLASRLNISRVFGVIDGDGRACSESKMQFDPPYAGPLFIWKAYCIESMVVKTGWPEAWGEAPDWKARFLTYAPYIAINRVGLSIRSMLREVDLGRHSDPRHDKVLRSPDDFAQAIISRQDRISAEYLETQFREEVKLFGEMAERDLDEVHAVLNGKWIVEHMAPTITGRTLDRCREDWITHARASGGLPEVREWWGRIIGSPT